MSWVLIVYDLMVVIIVLTSLVAFLATFNTVFPEGKSLIFRLKFKELKEHFKEKPIRAGLTAISFLIFFGMSTSYIVPVEIDSYFLIRTALLRLPILASSVIILLTVVHIQQGDWKINNQQLRKDNGVRPLED